MEYDNFFRLMAWNESRFFTTEKYNSVRMCYIVKEFQKKNLQLAYRENFSWNNWPDPLKPGLSWLLIPFAKLFNQLNLFQS